MKEETSDDKQSDFLGSLCGSAAGNAVFMAIRPQKKEKQRQQELLNSVAVGDTILTSSGFYGVIIDMTDDTVIVEFGNNKTVGFPCRKLRSSRLRSLKRKR